MLATRSPLRAVNYRSKCDVHLGCEFTYRTRPSVSTAKIRVEVDFGVSFGALWGSLACFAPPKARSLSCRLAGWPDVRFAREFTYRTRCCSSTAKNRFERALLRAIWCFWAPRSPVGPLNYRAKRDVELACVFTYQTGPFVPIVNLRIEVGIPPLDRSFWSPQTIIYLRNRPF